MQQPEDSMLSADTSPYELGKRSGVRRVNNLPLYLVGGAIGGFLLMMGVVGIERANKSQATTRALPEKHGDSLQLAASIAGNQTGGMVPAAVTPAPLAPLPTVPIAIPDDLEKPPLPKRLQQTVASNPMAERINQEKMQLFESAVKSKSSVPFSTLSSHGSASDTVQRQQILERIEGAKQQLASVDDVNTAFRARLAQLHSDGVAQEPTRTMRNSMTAFDAKNTSERWKLGSQVESPASPYTLHAGFVIPATLISGINSDLAGQIIGQVSQDVYDTATGKFLLLPQGSRLVGSYSSDVAYGQSRVMVAWQRIIFPDGKTLAMGAMPGTDGAGYSGFNDQVDNHYARIFGSAILMSGITAGVSYSQNTNSNAGINAQPTASSAMSEALGQQLGSTASQMISKNLSISPTLEIRPGFRFNVMCVKDLVMDRPYSPFDYSAPEENP